MYAWAAAGLKLPGEVPNKHELGILKLQDGLCLVPGGGQLSLTLCPNPYVSEAAVSGTQLPSFTGTKEQIRQCFAGAKVQMLTYRC